MLETETNIFHALCNQNAESCNKVLNDETFWTGDASEPSEKDLKNFIETEGMTFAMKSLNKGVRYELMVCLNGNIVVTANNSFLYRGTDYKRALEIYNEA